MTLYDMKAFYRWLNEASDTELVHRRDEVLALLATLTEAKTIESAQYVVSQIEAELLAHRLPN